MRRSAAHWTRWLQWAVAASIVLALGIVAFATFASKPRDSLYITIGELRSHAAEAQQVAHDAAALRLTSTFILAQSEQLLPRITSLRDDLVKAEQKPERQAAAHEARALADRLLDVTQELRSRADSPAASSDLEKRFEAILSALRTVERTIRP